MFMVDRWIRAASATTFDRHQPPSTANKGLIMTDYVYRWSIQPEHGFNLELRVTARSVAVARREVQRFLVDHEGSAWAIESVSRETEQVPHELFGLPTVTRH